MSILRNKLVVAIMIAVAGLTSVGSAYAGPVGGPKISNDSVLARASDSYDVSLNAGSNTRITVRGDGDTDLDLFVYDENGNLVGSDTDSTDFCIVDVNPKWTGQFRIVIRNLGNVYNQYSLRVE